MQCCPWNLYCKSFGNFWNSLYIPSIPQFPGEIIISIFGNITHSLIREVLIQSCSAGAKKFTNYAFCHPQFTDVIQNIENCCAIRGKFKKNWFLLYKIGYFDNNQHRQIGVKMAQQFSILWITPLNCGWQNT